MIFIYYILRIIFIQLFQSSATCKFAAWVFCLRRVAAASTVIDYIDWAIIFVNYFAWQGQNWNLILISFIQMKFLGSCWAKQEKDAKFVA